MSLKVPILFVSWEQVQDTWLRKSHPLPKIYYVPQLKIKLHGFKFKHGSIEFTLIICT